MSRHRIGHRVSRAIASQPLRSPPDPTARPVWRRVRGEDETNVEQPEFGLELAQAAKLRGHLKRVWVASGHAKLKLARELKPGMEFSYVFDLGDNWRHRCRVQEAKVDPIEAYGVVPSGPVPL